jgi:hypothetical protein
MQCATWQLAATAIRVLRIAATSDTAVELPQALCLLTYSTTSACNNSATAVSNR